MLKNMLKLLKRIIIYSFLLYGYNIIIEPLNLYIPINFITVGALSILGVPALFCLIFILIFIY